MNRKHILDIILLVLSAAVIVTKAVVDKELALETSETINETNDD